MTNKQNITDKVLARIETTTPRSRAYFSVRNAMMWVLAGLSILIGALAVSSIIFRVVNAERVLRPGTPPVSELLLLTPFLWIAVTVAFGYLAYREVRLTRKGYKYEFSTLLLGTVLASCVLGIAFYATGAGFELDRAAARLVPFHPDLERIQRNGWQQPQDGFLVGVILERTETGIRLTDPEEVVWQVSFGTTVSAARLETLIQGQRVGIRGQLLDGEAHTFLACDVRSLEFEGRGPMRSQNRTAERNILPPRSNECEGVRPPN